MTDAIASHSAFSRITGFVRRADRMAEIITLAAAGVLAYTGSKVAIQMMEPNTDIDGTLASALLLNIALIFFAWSRQRDAHKALVAQFETENMVDLLEQYDPGTQLYNRRALFKHGEQLVDSTSFEDTNLALMVLNIKRFGRVNELHGHSVGDAVLNAVANVLRDTIPDTAIAARLNGDEFAVMLPFAEGEPHQVDAFAQSITDQLARPLSVRGLSMKIATSIGVAKLDLGCNNFSTLLRHADIAMTSARASGALISWFDGSMDKAFRNRCEVELGLRHGIPRGEFIPFYQPQIDTRTNRIVGFEMLARWQVEPGRIIEPKHFIAIAEETDQIDDLFDSLFGQALDDARQWGPDLDLSVNVAPKQLHDNRFPDKVFRLLEEHGFPPDRLDIEITESSLYENLSHAQAVVARIKDQGISLSIDDFGTGYSSLAHLRAMPFDRLKIDRSFTLSMNKDPESWVLIQAITQLAKGLSLPVTIEGIESAAIDLRLAEVEFDRAQGWYHGKPLSASETLLLLRQHGHQLQTDLPSRPVTSQPAPGSIDASLAKFTAKRSATVR